MGGSYFGNAGAFLIQTLFGMYILAVMLRFLLQWVRADFYNPVSQFLVKVTNPPLRPLRRIIPGLFGLDLASVLLMVLLQVVMLLLLSVVTGMAVTPLGLFVLAVAQLLGLLLNVFFYGILIQAILSWVNPGVYNPVTSLLHALNEPLLRPARRLLPPISGLDLSPVIVLIALQLLSYLVAAPLIDMAYLLMRT